MCNSLWVHFQKFSYKIFGHLTDIIKKVIFGVKIPFSCADVTDSFIVIVTHEWRETTQSNKSYRNWSNIKALQLNLGRKVHINCVYMSFTQSPGFGVCFLFSQQSFLTITFSYFLNENVFLSWSSITNPSSTLFLGFTVPLCIESEWGSTSVVLMLCCTWEWP